MVRNVLPIVCCSILIAGACAGGADQESADTAADSQVASPALPASAAAQGADHEFLRMMSDHHQGLVVIGEDAMNRATDDSVRNAAHMLHTKQKAGQDTMVMMISQMYGEQYTPKIMPKNAAQADSLRERQGVESDRYFLQTTIAHHEEGIGMIDRFMPRFEKPEVRAMATKMREDQQREIRNLQGKLRQL